MQGWFITLCTVVFLLSCANTYIQGKRRAFILACLGFTGILFCLSFLIAAISLPENKTFNSLNKKELIICYITGIMLAIQTMALLSIVFALSIELYVTFRIKNRAIRDSLILKSAIVFFCCFQPTLFVTLNIVLMLIENIQIVDIIEEGGWCNVKIGGNRWGVLFVRALPLWFTSIPGALIACAAIIPSLIMAIKTRRKHREPSSQSEKISKEVSNDTAIRPTSPTSAMSPVSENDLSPSTNHKIPNEAITRMALYCILYSAIGIPYSVYGLINFFNYWKGKKTLDIGDTILQNYLSAGIWMATLILIFLVFATNGSSIKQYKEAWTWWKCNFFDPIYGFITRRKSDSIHADIVGNMGSNPTKDQSTSISVRTVITEEISNEMQEELPATVSSNITSKTKKRWSIFTASRESLIETEKAKKIRQSTDTVTFPENSSPTVPLFNQKITNRNINLPVSLSATALTIDSSESSSTQNNDSLNKLTVPILGGLSPAPRRTSPHSSPLRDYIDDKDDEIIASSVKRVSTQIRNPRQTASAPTSPTSTSSMRILTDRYNPSRRFTSPLRGPSSMANNRSGRSSVSTTTSYSQETPTTNTTFTTFEDMQEEFEETEPFPSILKTGKTEMGTMGTWRPASPLALASRSIRMSSMSNSGTYNSNIWDRPDIEAIGGLSSSPTKIGNLFRSSSSK